VVALKKWTVWNRGKEIFDFGYRDFSPDSSGRNDTLGEFLIGAGAILLFVLVVPAVLVVLLVFFFLKHPFPATLFFAATRFFLNS
jgi:hypothetical protein